MYSSVFRKPRILQDSFSSPAGFNSQLVGCSNGAMGGGAGAREGEGEGRRDEVTQGFSSTLSTPSGEVGRIGHRRGGFALKREERVERRLFRTAVASGSGSGSGAI